MAHHHNAGQNHNIKIANKPSKMWQSPNIWECRYKNKTACMKKLRAD
jgi:hypothetical protein